MTHILLVEDNLMAQLGAKMCLQQINCTVDVASNGKEALRLVQENQYHLIFMDISLGEENGFDVAKEIRNSSEKNKDIPIIALTAFADEDKQKLTEDEEFKKLMDQTGVNGYFVKPLTVEVAQSIFKKYL